MKYKKALLLVLLTILTSVFQLSAMHQLGRVFTKNFAKKAFSKTMTGLNWGISAGPMIGGGIASGYINELFGKQLLIKTTEVSDNVKSFVQDALNDDKVNIKKIDNPLLASIIPIMTTSKNILIGEPTFMPSLENAVEVGGLEKDKKMWEHILHHEHNHQKAKDPRNFFIAMFAIPFGIHYAARLVGRKVIPYATKAFTKTCTKPKSTNGIKWFFKEASKIPTGIAKLVTNLGLFRAYTRHREQKADDNTPEDIDILEGGARGLRKNLSYKQQHNQHQLKQPNILLSNVYKRLFSSHPSDEHRLEKFESRIKNLEQQE